MVTMYGATGNPTAMGMQPFVGGAACPRQYPLGTRIEILGVPFICDDRTNIKYDGRFDLFSKGTKQQMIDWGKKKEIITIYKPKYEQQKQS